VESEAPQIGDRFPVETLTASGGERIDLRARDGPAVIYFYPLDGTETCARDARMRARVPGGGRRAGCGLRDAGGACSASSC